MGNTVSGEREKPDRRIDTNNDSAAAHTTGLQPDKRSAISDPLVPGTTDPDAAITPAQNDPKKNAQFRLSVTASIDERAEQSPSNASRIAGDQQPELGARQNTNTASEQINYAKLHDESGGGAVNTPRAVPVSTGKSGDSVRGPYYRTRALSVNRDTDIVDEEQQQQQQLQQQQQTQSQRITRKPSVVKDQQPKGVTTIITWSQGGHNVYVTGTFNGWKHKIKLVKSTHDFSAVLELPPGTHRLKFIVDDEWKCSNEMETATDPDGNLVNYLQVLDENDDSFDEFGEMKTDPDTISRSSTPDSAYISEIPQELLSLASSLQQDEQGKQISLDWDHRQQQPPSLPPHLEKVLLNSQAVSEEDNSVLPEPNHVTLNHLYASSIKDNVMALSTTTRYRKKYVTTMYYRPVVPKS
ncbi:hypothetical protein BX666DRAFT_2029930 [Dichotomocladium elegans]|nr:hypothetical protein BX666DRAFT_2029930 [Dichotomocladium elegans]